MKTLNYILLALVLLLAWVIGMKTLLEPDMWWYLRTGEWIIENGGAPTTDVFSFTFFGTEWINVKWLYEVVVYGFSKIGGPEFTSIFQSIFSVLIALTSFGIYRQISMSKNTGIWALVTIPVLLISSYRMTARPETISHLFSLLAILIYYLGKNKNFRFYFLWIPLQILWTNMHEAYATGLIVMGCFVAWESYLTWKSENKLTKQPILIAFLISILGVALNPRGFYMLIHPFEIFSQLNENKFTTELFSYDTHIYWQQWQSKAFVVFIVLFVLMIIFSKGKNIKEGFVELSKSIGVGYMVVIILFAYLGFSAQRNIPFFVLASSPVIAYGLTKIISNKLKFPVLIVSLLLALTSYGMIVSNKFYELTDSNHTFGLQVSSGYNPIGLTKELEKIEYKQPHFSDYLSSSYPLWAIKDYQSFIDLRDLDVFPKAFFNDVILVTQDYPTFKKLDELNKFEYAYLKRTDFAELIGNLNQDTNWRMVFADPIACLFIKEADQKHQDIFKDFSELENTSISNGINAFFNPLYIAKKPEVNIDYMAATFYVSTGDYELALPRLKLNEWNGGLKYDGLCLKAQILNNLSLDQSSDSLMNVAWGYLKEAQQLDKTKGGAFYQSGLMLFQRGNINEAVSAFKISLKREPNNIDALTILANCQNSLMQSDPANEMKYVKKWFEYMGQAYALDPDNALIAYQLGVSYCDRNDCDKAGPILKNLGPLPYLSDAENRNLLDCKRKCEAD